jgi:hypothetical protein
VIFNLELEKGKERKLSQLLLKYGDLNLVQGIFTAYRKRLFPVFVTKNSSTNQKKSQVRANERQLIYYYCCFMCLKKIIFVLYIYLIIINKKERT